MPTRYTNNITYIDEGQIREMQVKGEPFHEHWMLINIKKLGKLKGIYIDVGAHVGNHTIFFANHCKAKKVYAYEPTPNTFKILKQNVEQNCKPGIVNVFPYAVGEKSGTCSVIEKNRPGQNRINTKHGEIKMIALNEIKDKVALIKIDVEGLEREVIIGALPLIQRDLPELFIESFEGHQWIQKLLPKQYKFIKTYGNAPSHHFSAKRNS